MLELRQSTAVVVRVGPAMDATDGVTPETTLALGTADQAELLKHDGAAAVDISGRTFVAVTGCDGWYDLTLTATDTNTPGTMDIVIQDTSLNTPVFRPCAVVSQAFWDAKYGTGGMPADLTEVGGKALEAGTAQAGTTTTITLAAGASAVDLSGGWIFFTGGTGAGQGAIIDSYVTGTKVATLGKTLTTAPDATTTYIILPYGFNVSTTDNPIPATVVELQASALADAFNTDSGTTYASAVAGSLVSEIADKAAFETADEVITAATHNVPNSLARRIRTLQDTGGYQLASVWVNEPGGLSTGTTDYEDATVTNRANDFDNAQTVADSVGLNDIRVSNGNSITLTAALEGYNVFGNISSIDFNGQNIGNTVFDGFLGTLSGVGTSTGGIVVIKNSDIGNVTLPPGHCIDCMLKGTFTVGSVGDYIFKFPQSHIPGAGSPTIDFNNIANTTFSVRSSSGGLILSNLVTGCVVSVDALSGGSVTVGGTGGTVHIRGMVAVNDTSGGAVNIIQTQVVNSTTIGSSVLAAAAADPIDANVEQLNTVPLIGDGGTGTEFSV